MKRNLKLAPKFYGPFQVIQRVGQVACKLQLPPTASIHHVFHVLLLKKKVGNQVVPMVGLLQLIRLASS